MCAVCRPHRLLPTDVPLFNRLTRAGLSAAMARRADSRSNCEGRGWCVHCVPTHTHTQSLTNTQSWKVVLTRVCALEEHFTNRLGTPCLLTRLSEHTVGMRALTIALGSLRGREGCRRLSGCLVGLVRPYSVKLGSGRRAAAADNTIQLHGQRGWGSVHHHQAHICVHKRAVVAQ